jgi:hypothetical protein
MIKVYSPVGGGPEAGAVMGDGERDGDRRRTRE